MAQASTQHRSEGGDAGQLADFSERVVKKRLMSIPTEFFIGSDEEWQIFLFGASNAGKTCLTRPLMAWTAVLPSTKSGGIPEGAATSLSVACVSSYYKLSLLAESLETSPRNKNMWDFSLTFYLLKKQSVFFEC